MVEGSRERLVCGWRSFSNRVEEIVGGSVFIDGTSEISDSGRRGRGCEETGCISAFDEDILLNATSESEMFKFECGGSARDGERDGRR